MASFLKFLFADLKAISNELTMSCLLNILINFFPVSLILLNASDNYFCFQDS